jgi:GNAT superfamily N-acetyltransferase
MIRLAREFDIPRLVEMGLRFRQETSYCQHIKENPEQMSKTAKQLIATNGLLVSERQGNIIGMLGFVIYPHFLSGEICAGEVFWWVEPEHRGEGVKLLKETEKIAKKAGAARIQMIAPNEKVAEFYRLCGYEYVETAFQKSL